jgi:hypothetical protein
MLFLSRLTRRVSQEEQELITFPEHMSSPPVFGGVRVTRSLVLYVCFADRWLSFVTFDLIYHCLFVFSITIVINMKDISIINFCTFCKYLFKYEDYLRF